MRAAGVAAAAVACGGALPLESEVEGLDYPRLRQILARHAVPFTSSVEEAVRVCLQKMEQARAQRKVAKGERKAD